MFSQRHKPYHWLKVNSKPAHTCCNKAYQGSWSLANETYLNELNECKGPTVDFQYQAWALLVGHKQLQDMWGCGPMHSTVTWIDSLSYKAHFFCKQGDQPISGTRTRTRVHNKEFIFNRRAPYSVGCRDTNTRHACDHKLLRRQYTIMMGCVSVWLYGIGYSSFHQKPGPV